MKGCVRFLWNKLRRRGCERLGLGGGAVLLTAVLVVVVATFLVLVALLAGLLGGGGLGAHGEGGSCETV
jgi:hypothetical protein